MRERQSPKLMKGDANAALGKLLMVVDARETTSVIMKIIKITNAVPRRMRKLLSHTPKLENVCLTGSVKNARGLVSSKMDDEDAEAEFTKLEDLFSAIVDGEWKDVPLDEAGCISYYISLVADDGGDDV